MTIYERGDAVYVPFLFTDRDKAKVRPAVVISSASFNESRSDVVIAGITSNVSREHFIGQLILEDWSRCGLLKPCAVSGIVQTVRETQIGNASARSPRWTA
jgi:PemK-like, MazF-like toxin of type II toxin-antitoxin system